MYVIARHEGERITMLNGEITIKVLGITGRTVRLGFEAPPQVDIVRVRENELQKEDKTFNLTN